MSLTISLDRNPFSRAAVVLLFAAITASLAVLRVEARWSLLPLAVLFGWSQLGGA
jgi:hypothetical protein